MEVDIDIEDGHSDGRPSESEANLKRGPPISAHPIHVLQPERQTPQVRNVNVT